MPVADHRYTPLVDFTIPTSPSGTRASTLPGSRPASLGSRRLTMEPPPLYPGAMVNVTNHCNLHCKHCFVFREGNPNQPEDEMKPERVLSELERRPRYGPPTQQLNLFAPPDSEPVEETHPVVDELSRLAPDELSPRQALDELYRLRNLLD